MILGTHNSMSYLPVAQWWLRPFRAWGRCQRLDYFGQWDAGARYFDLRIKFDSDGRAHFGHGRISYSCAERPEKVILKLLELAAQAKKDIYLRILLEQRATRESRRLFAAWIDATNLVHWLDLMATGWHIGHKKPDGLIYPDNMGRRVVTAFMRRDGWWQRVVPPVAWQWWQRWTWAKMEKNDRSIVSMDFVK